MTEPLERATDRTAHEYPAPWYPQQLPVRTPHRAYTWLVQHWPMVDLITLFSLLVIWRVCK